MANWYVAYTDHKGEPCSLAVFGQETIEVALAEAIRTLNAKPECRVTAIELVAPDAPAWFQGYTQAH